jgi:hypothetical protein
MLNPHNNKNYTVPGVPVHLSVCTIQCFVLYNVRSRRQASTASRRRVAFPQLATALLSASHTALPTPPAAALHQEMKASL